MMSITLKEVRRLVAHHRVAGLADLQRLFDRILPLPKPPSSVSAEMPAGPRTKATAGANETEDIAQIVAAIHSKTPAGLKLTAAFQTRFGQELLDARARKGNRGVHYDFEILVGPAPGAWKKVEHKGSKHYTPIKPEDTPWAAGVQFHNGGCELYSIARLYTKAWYDTQIGSGSLKEEWKLAAPIPSYEEWYACDAKAQKNPKTPFGIELKQKVRAAGADLLGKRAAAQAAFNPTSADIETLKAEILPIMNKTLAEKEFWLTIHGEIEGDFHCAWYPPFQIGEIEEVIMKKERDIWFEFKCSGTSFKAILRSGKALFSNFRMDAR